MEKPDFTFPLHRELSLYNVDISILIRDKMFLKQKGSATMWIIIVIVILGLILIGLNPKDDDVMEDIESEDMMADEIMAGDQDQDEVSDSDDVMPEKDMTEDEMDTVSMPMSGTYTDYSPEKVANAKGDIVLFFHAKWCPTCRGLDAAINSELSMIPKDLTILKVDYDTSSELKAKYGVTLQHTLVQVDSDGKMITKWSGGGDVSSIVSKIK